MPPVREDSNATDNAKIENDLLIHDILYFKFYGLFFHLFCRYLCYKMSKQNLYKCFS